MNTPILSSLSPRAGLAPAEATEMHRLLARHFEGVTREQFDRDLAGKSHVIRLWRAGELVGFSTLLAYETCFEGAPVSVIYSGDTIVAPEAWGTTALSRTWIASVNRLRAAFPRGPYYWLLLTSGFRTYRFLPLFWKEFYPRYDCPTPRAQQRLLEYLATERFASQFDPQTGVVRFDCPQRLRAELNGTPDSRKRDPHIQFFESRNPGHGAGDELVCLTELAPGNLTAAGRRMVSQPSNANCDSRGESAVEFSVMTH